MSPLVHLQSSGDPMNLKFTAKRQKRFLEALANTGNISQAVALSGTNRSVVYAAKKRDESFAAAWDEALEVATDALEQEARRRAVLGVDEPIVSHGRLIVDDHGNAVTVKRYSDQLLIALLKAHSPKFRDRTNVNLTGNLAIHDARKQLALEIARLRNAGDRSADPGHTNR